MKKVILQIIFLIMGFGSFSQTLSWEKLINYLPSEEVINSVDQDSDTTFVYCGTNGAETLFLRALLNGDTLWKKHKNVSTCGNEEFLKYIGNGQIMHFGNRDVGGTCSQVNFSFQKLDENGSVLSSWDYGNIGVANYLEGFDLLADGGFLGSGYTGDNDLKLSLMKINNLGNKVWYKTFWSPTVGGGVKVNYKGNYVLYGDAGDQPSYFVTHPYFIELSPDGDSIYSKYLIVKADTADEVMGYNAMIQTSNNNYIFSVRLDSVQKRFYGPVLGTKAGVVLMDSLFNIKWTASLKPAGTQTYYTSQVIELKDSTYIAIVNNGNPQNLNFYLYKISKTGQVLNKKTFSSSICNGVILNEMRLMSDSSLIVAGGCSNANGDAYIARITGVGLPQTIDTCKTFRASFKAEQNGDSLQFINTSNGGYDYAKQSIWKFADSTSSNIFSPKMQVTGTIDSVWARLTATNGYGCTGTVSRKVKVAQLTAINQNAVSYSSLSVNVFPNPFSHSTVFNINGAADKTYKLSIISSLGETIQAHEIKNQNTFTLNRSGIPAGLYLYILSDEEGKSVSGKLLVE
jgi:hypothetical protein